MVYVSKIGTDLYLLKTLPKIAPVIIVTPPYSFNRSAMVIIFKSLTQRWKTRVASRFPNRKSYSIIFCGIKLSRKNTSDKEQLWVMELLRFSLFACSPAPGTACASKLESKLCYIPNSVIASGNM